MAHILVIETLERQMTNRTEAKRILKDLSTEATLLKATAVAYYNDFELGTLASFVLNTLYIRENSR
jgi:hypothetical protein